jgi:DNA-binding HxlR family transcriptional regulator
MSHPPALDWSAENCTIGRTLDLVGERWTFLVLREIFLGIRRFDDIRQRTAIPRQALTDRLAALVGRGLLRRVPYREPGARERHEYRLTEQGFDLYPILLALLHWGDRYLADPAGPALVAVHRDCGEPIELVLRCAAGHEARPREVISRPGPGARRRTRPRSGATAGAGAVGHVNRDARGAGEL